MANIHPEEMQMGAGGQGPHPVPMRACEECHRKKTKCDMARPVCGLCQRTISSCHYPSRRRAPARPSKRQKTDVAGLPDGNLAWLLNLIANADATQLPDESAQELAAWRRLSDGLARTTPLSASSVEQILDDNAAETPAEDRRPQPEQSMPEQPLPEEAMSESIPYDVAMDLVEAFFTHIQPWLPALHKPRFMQKCAQCLLKTSDSLQYSSLEMKLLLNSMFALSARFSASPYFASIKPSDRDSRFRDAAHQAYAALRGIREPTLTYLQGCILLAFHAYTVELNSPAWILTGVCVRIAYDLGLSEIDDDSSDVGQGERHVALEEMRRAWWLTWELDTFGSIITCRPYAIDRDHFTVNLPIADADWFSEKFVRSAPLATSLDQAWTSLQKSENQDPRAWFLVTNHLLSMLCTHLQRKRKDFIEGISNLETAFNCLRLSLPPSFHILRHRPGFEADNFANCNWIMGTHLILMTVSSMFALISANKTDQSSPLSVLGQKPDDSPRLWALALSRLMGAWPVEYMTAAHPFFVCMLIPTHLHTAATGVQLRSSLEGVEQMVELIMMHFAKKWKLGGDMIDVLQELRNIGTESAIENSSLRRRFPVYFPRKTALDTRQDPIATPMQGSALSDLQEAAFDYQYFLASPSGQEITSEVERDPGLYFNEVNHNMENPELRNFHLTPSMALLGMMHGQTI
ncbi:hypothetical protein IQ07DRAFT_649778 [Pyrenochaeta sp. DS3sAY3a]|nr:hypothetical protein IQ07DRAFT_649778 [Pyrenochaeta sp. DS3sAY3a]